MSIRSNAMPYRGFISRELDEVLRRNGMRAQIGTEGDRYVLFVQGHDSPPLKYEISEQQVRALAEGGTNFANKKAYNTFNSIVGRDFDLPSSYVAARNAFGSVTMGLHGYRESFYGPGRGYPTPYHANGPGFLGWSPWMQDGFHLRRIGGVAMFAGGTMMVPEHSDGRLRPGELRSGSYGYYYHGQSQASDDYAEGSRASRGQVVDDPIKTLDGIFVPVKSQDRSKDPAIPYSEQIKSDVYFSTESWQKVLSSHGIIIDADKMQLTVQSAATPYDKIYNLSDKEVSRLLSNDPANVSVQQRLDLINGIIGGQFKDPVTRDMLESRDRIAIALTPAEERNLDMQVQQRFGIAPVQNLTDPRADNRPFLAPTQDPEKGYVNVQDGTDERKGWYREGRHGREVEVSELWVDKVHVREGGVSTVVEPGKDRDLTDEEKKQGDRMTYRMTAVINGEAVTHEISQKQYEKFLTVDDYQRQRMMSKVFDEVDMKTRPEERRGFNLPAFLAAGLYAAREATWLGAGIAQDIDRIKHPGPRPEVYQEVHGTANILHKPEIESPQELAARAYRAGVETGLDYGGRGR